MTSRLTPSTGLHSAGTSSTDTSSVSGITVCPTVNGLTPCVVASSGKIWLSIKLQQTRHKVTTRRFTPCHKTHHHTGTAASTAPFPTAVRPHDADGGDGPFHRFNLHTRTQTHPLQDSSASGARAANTLTSARVACTYSMRVLRALDSPSFKSHRMRVEDVGRTEHSLAVAHPATAAHSSSTSSRRTPTLFPLSIYLFSVPFLCLQSFRRRLFDSGFDGPAHHGTVHSSETTAAATAARPTDTKEITAETKSKIQVLHVCQHCSSLR